MRIITDNTNLFLNGRKNEYLNNIIDKKKFLNFILFFTLLFLIMNDQLFFDHLFSSMFKKKSSPNFPENI